MTGEHQKESDQGETKQHPAIAFSVSAETSYDVIPEQLFCLQCVIGGANLLGSPFVGLQTAQGITLIGGTQPPASFGAMPPVLEYVGLSLGILESGLLRNIQVVPNPPKTHRAVFKALPHLKAPVIYGVLLAAVTINGGVLGYGSTLGLTELIDQLALSDTAALPLKYGAGAICIPGTIFYSASFSGKEVIDAANAIGALSWRWSDACKALSLHGRQWLGAAPEILANAAERIGPYAYIGAQSSPWFTGIATGSSTLVTLATRSRLALAAATKPVQVPGKTTPIAGYPVLAEPTLDLPKTAIASIFAGLRPALPLSYLLAQSWVGNPDNPWDVLYHQAFWTATTLGTLTFGILRAPENAVFKLPDAKSKEPIQNAHPLSHAMASAAMLTYLGVRIIYNANYWNLLSMGLFPDSRSDTSPGVVLGLAVSLVSMPPEMLMRYQKFLGAFSSPDATAVVSEPADQAARRRVDSDAMPFLKTTVSTDTVASAASTPIQHPPALLETPPKQPPTASEHGCFYQIWQALTCCYLRPVKPDTPKSSETTEHISPDDIV